MKIRLLALPLIVAACATVDELAPVEPESTTPPPAGFAPAGLPATAALPRPDAGAPDAAPVAVVVPGIAEPRLSPPPASSCGGEGETPVLPEERAGDAPADEIAKRLLEMEEDGGLDKREVQAPEDRVTLGDEIGIAPRLALIADADGDCLSDADETRLGTDPKNPDSDGDGWYDGACNQRYKLILTRIYARDEQEDWGDDELYLVVDDVRHPQADLDDYWNFDDGASLGTSWLLATRTRGVNMPKLAPVVVEGWEDDFEIVNTWTPDDLLWRGSIDLGTMKDGDTFVRRHIDTADDDYDYELAFRVQVERFADPSPRARDADVDHDGISELNEARVARDFGGVVDPTKPDVLVEVDWMPGHEMRTEGKRQVVTQYYRNGLGLRIYRNQALPADGCVTVPEARALYAGYFGYKGYGAFRYSVISGELWNDRSGVAWGDIFFVDDSTWWINNWVLPQAGTFIHELGHTLGLNKEMFHLIDSVAWFSYDSAMNYLYQATKVDYSYDGAGGDSNDHDDWGALDAAYGLRWSFALTTSTDTGGCN